VSRYLRGQSYRIVPVNPLLRGATVEGERAYDRLADIPKDIAVDFVDVFRRGQYLDAVVDDAHAAGVKAMWFQLGLGNIDAAKRAEELGMKVVWDQCTAIEHRRLGR
jgi:predicted CoA-binding protein